MRFRLPSAVASAMAPSLLFAGFVAAAHPARAAEGVFVNEIHYDNEGVDTGEGIEVAGPAGTDLGRFRLELYNGNGGSVYGSMALSGVIDDEDGTGFGAVFFPIPGLQNGSPDGYALFDVVEQRVLAFESYEGTFVAVGGAAVGTVSTDIGVRESGSTPAGHSLQRFGTGRVAGDFAWRGPRPASPGRLNDDQSVSGERPLSIRVTTAAAAIAESGAGGGPESTELTVQLDPPPSGPRVLLVIADAAEQVAAPSEVVVGVGGAGVVEVVAVADRVPDGDRRVTLRIVDPAGDYDEGSLALVVRDEPGPDLRAGALRVMALNVENGVGAEGSAEFAAVRHLLGRIGADVVAMQEVQGDDAFGDLTALLQASGFAVTREHLAIEGDAFRDDPFAGGDFVFNQFLVVASRHPIVEAVQIGRGESAREHARFPLFVRIDVPELEPALDPAFVVVHHKAGSTDADAFRRAVESFRIARFLEDRGLDGESANVIVLGDFNDDRGDLQPASITTAIDPVTHVFPDGSGLPVSYRLGDDLTGVGAREIDYRPFPEGPLFGLPLRVVPAVQIDGRERTRNSLSRRRLDYLVVSASLLADGGPIPAEVYNSDLEARSMGLPKQGPPPPRGSSRLAGDHQAIFADLVLDGRPSLRVSTRLAPSAGPTLDEGDGPGALEAVVRLPAPVPAGESLAVALVVTPPEEAVARATTLVLEAGEIEGAVPIDLRDDGVPDPDRRIVVAAAAPGMATGYHRIDSRNLQPSGAVVVTRYLEPSASSTRRALELQNRTGRTLNLFDTPIEIRGHPGALATVPRDLLIEEGLLPPGGVLVLGQEPLADHLVSRGLIDDPGEQLGRFEGQTFFGPGGAVAFVLARWTFDGNDSIEILVDGTLSDVFGSVGDAPGLAWTGAGGLSTRDASLRRRADAPRGSGGWTDPAVRFESAGSDATFEGFGTGVAFTDAFAVWAEDFELGEAEGAPAADPDGDGSSNAVEFALGSRPDDARSRPHVEVAPDPAGEGGLLVAFRRRQGGTGVSVTAETTADLISWREAPVVEIAPPVDLGDGTEEVVGRVDAPAGTDVAYLRLRIELL